MLFLLLGLLALFAAVYIPAKFSLASLTTLLRPGVQAQNDVLPTNTNTGRSTALYPPPPLRGRGRSIKPSSGRRTFLGLGLGLGRRAKSLGPVLPRFQRDLPSRSSAPATPRQTLDSDELPLVDLSQSVASWGSLSSLSSVSGSARHTAPEPPEAPLVDVSHEGEFELVDVSVPPSPAAWALAHPHEPMKPASQSFPVPHLSPAPPFPTIDAMKPASPFPAEAMNPPLPTEATTPPPPATVTTRVHPSIEAMNITPAAVPLFAGLACSPPPTARPLSPQPTHLPSPPMSPPPLHFVPVHARLPYPEPPDLEAGEPEVDADLDLEAQFPSMRGLHPASPEYDVEGGETDTPPYVDEPEDTQAVLPSARAIDALVEGMHVYAAEIGEADTSTYDDHADMDDDADLPSARAIDAIVGGMHAAAPEYSPADVTYSVDAELPTVCAIDVVEGVPAYAPAEETETPAYAATEEHYAPPLSPAPPFLSQPRLFPPDDDPLDDPEDVDNYSDHGEAFDGEVLPVPSELLEDGAMRLEGDGQRVEDVVGWLRDVGEEGLEHRDEESIPHDRSLDPDAQDRVLESEEHLEHVPAFESIHTNDSAIPDESREDDLILFDGQYENAHEAAHETHDDDNDIYDRDDFTTYDGDAEDEDVSDAGELEEGDPDELPLPFMPVGPVDTYADPEDLPLPAMPLPSFPADDSDVEPLLLDVSVPILDGTDDSEEEEGVEEGYEAEDGDAESGAEEEAGSDAESDAGAETDPILRVDTTHLALPAIPGDSQLPPSPSVREQDLASIASTTSSSASPSSAVRLLPGAESSIRIRKRTSPNDVTDVSADKDSSLSDSEAEEDLGRPAWSLRASGAPALGLPSSTREKEKEVLVPGAFPATTATSTALEVKAKPEAPKPRRRSPLDVALAMQLRPGLGAGADGAWLVRFLMSFFGWFAVLVAGGQEFS